MSPVQRGMRPQTRNTLDEQNTCKCTLKKPLGVRGSSTPLRVGVSELESAGPEALIEDLQRGNSPKGKTASLEGLPWCVRSSTPPGRAGAPRRGPAGLELLSESTRNAPIDNRNGRGAGVNFQLQTRIFWRQSSTTTYTTRSCRTLRGLRKCWTSPLGSFGHGKDPPGRAGTSGLGPVGPEAPPETLQGKASSLKGFSGLGIFHTLPRRAGASGLGPAGPEAPLETLQGRTPQGPLGTWKACHTPQDEPGRLDLDLELRRGLCKG